MTDQTLVDTVLRQARERPQQLAFRSGTLTLTFVEFESRTAQVANALAAAGVKAGDRVACLTQHHVQCLLLTLGACRIGAVCMPVNWRLAASEVEYILTDGQVVVLMSDAQFLPLVRAARLDSVHLTVCTESAAGELTSFASWIETCPRQQTPIEARPGDDALQLYSSGTTGLPKGVVLTHRGLISTCETVARDWRFGDRDVNGNPLPTFHVAGMTMLLLTLHAGGVTVAFPTFEPAVFIDAIAKERITHAFLVPSMLLFMLRQPLAREADYRTLRLVAYGGSPISETLLVQAMEILGCDFLQVYGLTEVSGPVSFLMPEDHRRAIASDNDAQLLRSAGKPASGARVRIVDPSNGEDMGESEVGEILIESIRNLDRYWRDDGATSRAFPHGRSAEGGWFRSGDGGYLRDGFLYINDRIKDMIVSGGENIYPAEVENVLLAHPAVEDAAVIGVPDDTWGESVKAIVVRRPGEDLAAADLIGFTRERMAHFKCPRSVDFVDALPRNPTGKILKRVLREPYWRGQTRAVN